MKKALCIMLTLLCVLLLFSGCGEKEAELSRLRTELMSGEGPDLFIVLCDEKEPSRKEEAVFTMPEKAMELSIFLTLDEYMENNTVFAEWDRMNQAILAAGRTDEGSRSFRCAIRYR